MVSNMEASQGIVKGICQHVLFSVRAKFEPNFKGKVRLYCKFKFLAEYSENGSRHTAFKELTVALCLWVDFSLITSQIKLN